MDSTIKIPELPELSFDEKSHIYLLDGVEIPSVSKVMEPLKASGYAGISERTLERAADKGSSVHNAIEMWLRFGVIDIPEEHRGYFNGFLEWWNRYKPELVASEVKVYHKLMRYAGTTDLLAYIDGKLTLVDYKTTYRVMEKSCGVQLEAYAQALASHGVEVEAKHILHLEKNGKWDYPEYPAKDAARWRVFGALKCVYDYTVA